MKLLVGLGNPGEKYQKTRHNLGFIVLEHALKNYEPASQTVWTREDKFKADSAQFEWKPKVGPLEKVLLLKPKTFMNNSGLSVRLAASYYKLEPKDIWVIHDDIDLRLGALRIRLGGASGGHRGIESVMQELGTEMFWRFRLGIGHPLRAHGKKNEKINNSNVDDFVLGEFNASERGDIKKLIHVASKALADALEEGLEVSINRFNTK